MQRVSLRFPGHVKFALAGIVVATLIVAACGGGGATATPIPPATSTPAPAATATPSPTRPGPAAPTQTPAPIPVPTPAATARYGGVLRLFLDPRVPGPIFLNDTFQNLSLGEQSLTTSMIHEPLLRYDVYNEPRGASIVENLAKTWSFNQGGTVLTLNLVRGAQWTDGKPFTSADVKFTFENIIKPPPGWITRNKASFTLVIDSIEAPDPSTVVLKLKKPSASLVPLLTSFGSEIWAAHMSLEESAKSGIGTGPYINTSSIAKVSREFKKNPAYWQKDSDGSQLPYLDGIKEFQLEDPTTLYATIIAGKLDLCHQQCHFSLSGRDKELKGKFPNAVPESRTGGNLGPLIHNSPPYDDIRVREALDIGYDRLRYVFLETQGESHFDGVAVVPPSVGGQWALPEEEILSLPGYRYLDKKTGKLETDIRKLYANPDNYVKDPADIARAKQLLKEAGLETPLTELKTTVLFQRGAEATAAVFQDVFGKSVDVKLVDQAALFGDALAGRFTAIYSVNWGGSPDDPGFSIPQFLTSPGRFAKHDFKFPDLDALYAQVDSELDTAKRKELTRQLIREIYKKRYIIFGSNTGGLTGFFTEDVHGVPLNPTEGNDRTLERVWLSKK